MKIGKLNVLLAVFAVALASAFIVQPASAQSYGHNRGASASSDSTTYGGQTTVVEVLAPGGGAASSNQDSYVNSNANAGANRTNAWGYTYGSGGANGNSSSLVIGNGYGLAEGGSEYGANQSASARTTTRRGRGGRP